MPIGTRYRPQLFVLLNHARVQRNQKGDAPPGRQYHPACPGSGVTRIVALAELVTAPYSEDRPPRQEFARWLEWAAVGLGIVLVILAAAADTAWFDRHVLPSFFMPRSRQLAIASGLRVVVGTAGLAVILIGRLTVRRYAQIRSATEILGTAAMTAVACIAALLTTEFIMRTQTWHAAQFHNQHEPRRIYDSGLGWAFMPGHHGQDRIAGLQVDYFIDSNGYRIAKSSENIDFNHPTIILSGESVMAGAGLPWAESLPGQLASEHGPQIADIAVTGYSTDQSYMRLKAQLARFDCPVAVVTLFMPSFLERNLNDDRPHLDRDLRWHPARQPWRLESLARMVFPYRRVTTIDDGVVMTRAVLRATNALAQARGAVSLLVVPVFTPESGAERRLRQRILDQAGLDYLPVPIASQWRLAGDMHPDQRGARAIAAAISGRLQSSLPGTAERPGVHTRNACGM